MNTRFVLRELDFSDSNSTMDAEYVDCSFPQQCKHLQ